MPEFYFDHVTTVTTVRRLRVVGDDAMQAHVRASVGGIKHILEKEHVELLDLKHTDEVVVLQVPDAKAPWSTCGERRTLGSQPDPGNQSQRG